jgi:hypothetical protein
MAAIFAEADTLIDFEISYPRGIANNIPQNGGRSREKVVCARLPPGNTGDEIGRD